MRYRLCLFSAFMLSSSIPALQAWADGTVEGAVRNSRGESLNGAIVSIVEKSKPNQAEIRYQEAASESGKFTISGVAPGQYTVIATYPGLRPGAQTLITVKDGERTAVELTLAN